MAKKNKKKLKRTHHHGYRNAAPRAPSVPRPRGAKPEEETPLKRLAYTAGGAAGTALAGSFLAHEGWAPKTIATALGAVGAGLAWKGDATTVRSIGAGMMSAAGSQLALMVIDERDKKTGAPATQVAKKPSNNAEALPPGALESALERAQARLALATGE
ncbi:MAG: hypothetical protein JO257_07870 [Deltaproteobacteria bacterium]|nr:hypothetical protein [Deltaproteobacteria bacterium]